MGTIVTFAASQTPASLNTVNTYQENNLEMQTQHPSITHEIQSKNSWLV